MKNSKGRLSKRRAIVLLSGGLDSAVTLYLAKYDGFTVNCLIFDYGQRHKKEVEAAKKIARQAGAAYRIIKLRLPWKGSSLLDGKIKIPRPDKADGIPSTYVPGRNIIFLSYAVSFAEAAKAGAVYIGAHTQDYPGYPDCRPQFYRAFSKTVSCGTKAGVEKKKIEIKTPLINKTKAEIIKTGVKLKVPFELTWSCYKGGRFPCAKCESCYFRSKGFFEAGLPDPILLR
ncbi:MAG: 7-cyano-7-deazaguanine synthase QueC [Candidatus Omnitrophica bacterium]|nr:7-cyano-7-deazaguanine synthase QueC [Candidatus Omnitrophota bacterium]MBL7152033.1 7-cyano-7-deazaguanine synthase QueC [Candidatus Omnitrophota bacterium]